MTHFVDDTPDDRGLYPSERARFAPSAFMNVVQASKHNIDTLTFVHRDPCPKCGVRADYGCKHRRAV